MEKGGCMMVKKWVTLMMTMLLAFSMSLSVFAATDVETPTWYDKVNYVSLGDSLAFGINDQNGIGKGYPEFIAETLLDEHLLNSFSNGYTFPGYTTADVLQGLLENKPRLDVGIHQQQLPVGTLDAVGAADLITITAGANDLLAHVTRTETGLTIDIPALLAKQQEVARNYADILTTIYEKNPAATVYVMGYYNAFAHLPADVSTQAAQLMNALNTTIEQAATQNGALFVPTATAIEQNIPLYLPNPANIHVSEAGHAVLAEQFIDAIDESFIFTTSANIKALATSPTIVDVTWDAPAHAEQVASYTVYVDDEPVAEVGPADTSLTITGLEPSTIYMFDVTFTDTDGKQSNEHLSTWELTLSAPNTYAFTDIQTHGDAFYIDRAAHLQLVNGYEDGTYRPSHHVTRAQMVKLLVNALHLEHEQAAPFTDIGMYAQQTQNEIAAAYEAGLIQGTDGKFRPNEPVTRAQLALMIARAYTYVTNSDVEAIPTTFTDTRNYNDEAQQAIQFLYDAHIVSGWEGRYMPNDATMRSHAAKVVVNFVDTWMK